MFFLRLAFLIFFLLNTDISAISGTLIDPDSLPVPNAKIELKDPKTIIYSDKNGFFEFNTNVSISTPPKNNSKKILLKKEYLVISTDPQEKLIFSVFSLSGKKLKQKIFTAAGSQTIIPLSPQNYSSGLKIVKLQTNNNIFLFKFVPFMRTVSNTNTVFQSESFSGSKHSNIDTLLIKKRGFQTKALPLTNSDNSYPDIMLNYDSIKGKVDSLLALMTIEEKIGQMTQAERADFRYNYDDISGFFLGSILSGGGSSPGDDPQDWADMYDDMQRAALSTRLGIPIIYGVDAIHGNNNLYGAVIFPHNIALGCTRNPELVRKAAEITAIETAATGIDWTFAPCVAVARDERWGRTYESFGEIPELQYLLAGSSVRGYEGNELFADTTIAACAKHYVGDGGTVFNTSTYSTESIFQNLSYLIDRGNTIIDEEMLRTIHLPGYIEAVRAGVSTVMASYSSWNGEKLHSHKYLITDLLKKELGFGGFVVSDWNGIDEIDSSSYENCIKRAINSGIDMVMAPNVFTDFISGLKNLVETQQVSIERIDDAVKRILRVKFELDLFEKPFTNRNLIDRIGSDPHRETARECVRQSIVLLKNDNNTLPLSKSEPSIAVIGKHADDIGLQCGGWSITWQGNTGNITTGTTILDGIINTVTNQDIVTYTSSTDNLPDAEYAVFVFGEEPYAEGYGDIENTDILSSNIKTSIEQYRSNGTKIICVLISGRPLDISSIIDSCDAFIAAWLPGTEGQGVADVLFGDYSPTGKLSFSWPRNSSQIPVNFGDQTYDPLFEYGFGLTY